MGSGLLKGSPVKEDADEVKPFTTPASEGNPVPPSVAPLLQAASRAKSASGAKLDEVLQGLSTGKVSETVAWLVDWLARAPAKSHGGVLLLLQTGIARALDASVTAVADRIARAEGNGNNIVDFGRLADICGDTLHVDESRRQGVQVAALVLTSDALAKSAATGHASYFVPTFDRIILWFRHVFLESLESSAQNLDRWREVLSDAGIPPLDEHLALVSCGAKAVLVSLLLIPDGVGSAPVVISREAPLRDAKDQLPDKHACIISPYFEAAAGTKVVQGKRVEGGEGHGPRKEFFLAMSGDALKKSDSSSAAMFEFHRPTGQNWFTAYANELSSPAGDELRGRFFTFGKLLAMAACNRCKLSFVLPTMFFKFLLSPSSPEPTLDDLKGFDDVLHGSLKKCLKMKEADFNAIKELDGLPAVMSREEYIAQQARCFLAPQGFVEIRRGFWSLASETALRGLTPADLRQIVCPVDARKKDINIKSIFKVTFEDGLTDESKLLADAFWAVIDGFSLAEKRSFLAFVTGTDAPPEPGTERLIISLPFFAFTEDDHIQMLNTLPQAHTCSNTLELPNYLEALQESGHAKGWSSTSLSKELHRILGEKLRMAIAETTGYELDAVEDDRQSTRHAHWAAEDAGARLLEEAEQALQMSPDTVSPGLSKDSVSLCRGEASPAKPAARKDVDSLIEEFSRQNCQDQDSGPLSHHHPADTTHDFVKSSVAEPSGRKDVDSLIEEMELELGGFDAPKPAAVF